MPELPKSTWNTKLLSQGLFSLQMYELPIPVSFGYIHWWVLLGFTKSCLSSTSCLWSQLLPSWVPCSPTLECRRILFKMKILLTIPGYPDTWLYHWAFSEPPFSLYKPVSHVSEVPSWSPSLRAKFAQAAGTHIARAHAADHPGVGWAFVLGMTAS